ncbi:MAG: DUF4349 domain-containing protein [Oscillospiraceae bacterium]|nr:DUF4349 domain-containing protein [Oscillospiraceae bacterium]
MNLKRSLVLLLALVMCLSLCACGSVNTGASAAKQSYSYEMGAAPAPMPEAAYDMAYEGAGFAAMNTAARSVGGAKAETADVPAENPEKIIYSGDATVETTEFDKSVAALEVMIEKEGGFIESSSINGSNYYDSSRGYASKRSASYTLRIPSAKFNTLMSSLSDIGNVPYTHTYTENVTAQYYDTQARLNALQAQETRLIEMLKIAETVEDIITIEDKLSDVRYRIDSLQSSLNNWDRKVAYSTLNVTVKEVQVYTPETVTKLSYGQKLWRTFTDALENTGEFFKDLLLFLVSAIPTLVILAVLFFVFRPLIRKLHANAKARREARKTARAAKKAEKTAAIQDAKIEADEMK